MNYAEDEKLRLLRWLLPDLAPGEVIAAELPFRDVKRKADLAVLSPSRLHVIEIKGPRDRIDTLLEQVEDYREAFLSVDVALSRRFVATARDLLPRQVGVIELAENGPVRIRQPIPRVLLSTKGALHWLHGKDLVRLLGDPAARSMDLTELREQAVARISRAELSAAALAAAHRRSSERYAAFLAERTEVLTLDDIAVLQTPTRVR